MLAGPCLEVVEAGEGVVAFGAEALVLLLEVLVLRGEPAPAAVLGGSFTAFTVQVGLQPCRFVFRCFQLAGESFAVGDSGGEFVASVEGLDERGRLGLTELAVPPGALTISSAGPFAGPATFAGDRHKVGA